jgi:hypothetical protein
VNPAANCREPFDEKSLIREGLFEIVIITYVSEFSAPYGPFSMFCMSLKSFVALIYKPKSVKTPRAPVI